MEELKKEISQLIEGYFDTKTENVDWRYDMVEEGKAKRIVKECISDILDELVAYDKEMDDHLEDFELMYTGIDVYEYDKRMDDYYRTRDLIDEGRRI